MFDHTVLVPALSGTQVEAMTKVVTGGRNHAGGYASAAESEQALREVTASITDAYEDDGPGPLRSEPLEAN